MGVCVALWDPSVALMDVPTLMVQLREGGAHLLSHLVIELSATGNYPELAAQHRVVPAGHRSARTTPLDATRTGLAQSIGPSPHSAGIPRSADNCTADEVSRRGKAVATRAELIDDAGEGRPVL